MKVIALVPARCGSKSIPLKNIKELCGQPLIYWVLEALEQADLVQEVYLATDCDQVEEVATRFNFKKTTIYRRLEANAQDTSSTEALLLEFIAATTPSADTILMLVQATSPFTTAVHFDAAINQYIKSGSDSLLTCARIKRFFWSSEGSPLNYDYQARPRRQDFDGVLMENGAFYINTVQNILEARNRLSGKIEVFEMPDYTATELDEPEDWPLAEGLMKKYRVQPDSVKRVIKLFLSDIDGVLTDAGMYYSEQGDELKKFSTYDGKAFELLRNKGILTGLITSENVKLNEKRAQKLKIDWLCQGANDKLAIVQDYCNARGIQLSEVSYIGDDVGDIELLKAVGVAACPANARAEVRAIDGIIHLKTKGGDGAVREFCELFL